MSRIEALLTEAANIRQKMEPYAALKNRLDEIRWELQQELTTTRSRKSDPAAGVYATRTEKHTFTIKDENDATDWLVQNDADMEALTKLDAKAVEAFVKARFRETGELPDGMGYETTEYVTLRTEDQDEKTRLHLNP